MTPSLLMAAGLTGFAVFALACCWLALCYARSRQLIDQPGERRSHQVATPRGGGAGIVAALLIALLVVAWQVPGWRVELLALAVALAAVAGIGWWDDHRPLPASWRLCVHLLAGCVLGWLLWRDGAGLGWSLFAIGLTAALVNIWNFMDGINGLAVSQAVLVAAAFALWLPPGISLLAWLVMLACLAFLPFNFPRARIFLGDVGSGALGLLMAALALLALRHGPAVDPLLLLLPMTVFLVDAGFTLAGRILGGQRWTQAHTDHLYQWYVKMGHSHQRITCAYAMVTLAACGAAVLLSVQPLWVSMLVSFIVWSVCGLVWAKVRSALQRRAQLGRV